MPVAPARRRIGRDEVITAAEELVDLLGWDGLTMAELAVALGVKAPSLYTHVRGLDDVRGEIQVRTMRDLGRHLQAAAMGRTHEDAFRSLAGAVHDFAVGSPHRYDGMTRAAIDRDAFGAAGHDASAALMAVLRSYGFTDDVGFEIQVAAFAALHGAVVLENSGFLGTEVDGARVYSLVLSGVLQALDAAARRPRTRGKG